MKGAGPGDLIREMENTQGSQGTELDALSFLSGAGRLLMLASLAVDPVNVVLTAETCVRPD